MQFTTTQSQNLLGIFEQLHLSEEQMEQMDDYMDGKVGEEVLTKLSFQEFRDAQWISFNDSAMLFLAYVKKGYFAEAKRYFDILFTIGGPSCEKMLPDGFWGLNQEKKLGIAMDKITAVYAYKMGTMQVAERDLKLFENNLFLVEKKTELIEKALCYQNGQSEKGKLILYTLYFWLKYPDIKPQIQLQQQSQLQLQLQGQMQPEEQNEQNEHNGQSQQIEDQKEQKKQNDKNEDSSKNKLFSGITRLFEKNTEIFLEKEDRKRMEEYENCVCGQVNFMLNQGLLSEEIQKISEGLHQEELSEETKKIATRHTKVSEVIQQITGLAFVNFALSRCLTNFISFSLSIDWNSAIYGMDHMDIRQDLRIRGGNFDELFGIDTENYILWAAQEFHKNILRVQFIRNREIYLRCCDTANTPLSNQLLTVLKELDLPLYQEKRRVDQDKEQEKILVTMVNNPLIVDSVRKYLKGEEEIDVLYRCEDQLTPYHVDLLMLNRYRSDFGEDEFYRRCVVLAALKQSCYFFTANMNGENIKAKTKAILSLFHQEKMDFFHQLKFLILLEENIYLKRNKEKLIAKATKTFAFYLSEQREEVLRAFQRISGSVPGRRFALGVLAVQVEENKEEILAYAGDYSKGIKEKLLEILYQQTDWEEDIKRFLLSRRTTVREVAVRVLAYWDVQKYQEELKQVLEKEKNTRIRAFLTEVLEIESGEEESEKMKTREDLVKELQKGGKSRTLAWAYQTPFSVVHRTNGEEASLEYLQAIFLCYSLMQPCGVNANAAFLAEGLHSAEFAVYVNELFDKWLEDGAEAKKRWVLYAASIHGGSEIVKKLQHQIQEWPQCARGAIASYAVQALSLNPDPQALLIVDGIARKFKFKQVKAAAGKALDFAAAQLGLEREELEDRIVPDLGFNKNMERIFDYGERQFTVRITTALEIEVYDGSGKKLKNLPAPGKKDDAEKASAAYEEFKQMKKQMKTTISSQKARLEWALSSERLWSVTSWNSLFVQNPLMHQFAIGLIWGIYKDQALVQSFRYMEDGTFNTEEEEEFFLPKDGRIGLVHPIELSEKSRAAWRQQMEDYEIVQPIVQLERAVFYLTEEEKKLRSLERFGGYILNDLSLSGKLQAFGWYRGSILDAGGYYTFYREDAKIGYGVELHFSGSCVGYSMGDVTLYDARFYRTGTIGRRNYPYEVEWGKGILLSEIPQRYFSEIVLQLALVTASSSERDENWRKGW